MTYNMYGYGSGTQSRFTASLQRYNSNPANKSGNYGGSNSCTYSFGSTNSSSGYSGSSGGIHQSAGNSCFHLSL